MLKSDKPLRRVHINLFDEDVKALERLYGYGWSERVRSIVHDYLRPRVTNDLSSTMGPALEGDFDD